VIAAFFDLVSSQDNTMIEAMYHLLTIHQTVSQTPSYSFNPLLSTLIPLLLCSHACACAHMQTAVMVA
jgi:hypothetical protein